MIFNVTFQHIINLFIIIFFFNFKGDSLVFDKPLKNHTKIIVIKLAIY